MSISGVYRFGELTTKSGKTLKFEDIDKDKDGKISQQEFNFIQKELCLDTVEFTDEDKKSEKKVSDFEYVFWSQESQMQDAFDKLCADIAKDIIGENSKYIPSILKELRQYLSDYKTDYRDGTKPLNDMAANFMNDLPVMYDGIKNSYLDK